MLFTRLGMPNGKMAMFTSLLYLPWVIKPLWSPFVDVVRSKRWWIMAMQASLAVAFTLLVVSMLTPFRDNSVSNHSLMFTLMLIIFWISAFMSATHDIAADGFYMLALSEKDQSLFVGIRSTFYRLSSIFGQGVVIAVAGRLESKLGDIPMAWQLTLLGCSVLMALLTVWHCVTLPKIEKTATKQGIKELINQIGATLVTFFRKRGMAVAILFMLLYRLPEALLIKMLNPFFVDGYESGGLSLTTTQVGLLYGTIGVLMLTIGGILGGIYVAHRGLRRSLMPMALMITLPDLLYLLLAMHAHMPIWIIGCAIAVEQFGYGFGFTAYMLYMIHIAEGEHSTSHYALCTAFMAAGMMLPGMVAGFVQESIGYIGFFTVVAICCTVTLLVSLIARKQLKTNE